MNPTALELIALGFLVGGFGTLIGAGGGFILVPVLVLLYPDMRPNLITSISLAIVFLNACSGSIAYGRMKRIDYKSALAFGLATLPGSVIGAVLTGYIPRHIFNIILGCILIIIAVFLFINPGEGAYASRKKGKVNIYRDITDSLGNHYTYAFNIRTGITLSFLLAFCPVF